MKWLLLFFLGLSACAQNTQYVNPGLQKEYNEFVVDVADHGLLHKMLWVDIIDFKKFSGNILGVCTYDFVDGKLVRVIYIDPEEWRWAGRTARLELMYHENGHCAFGQMQHNATKGTLMNEYSNTYGISEVVADEMWPKLKEDFFIDIKKRLK